MSNWDQNSYTTWAWATFRTHVCSSSTSETTSINMCTYILLETMKF